jgi:hypothetical protein
MFVPPRWSFRSPRVLSLIPFTAVRKFVLRFMLSHGFIILRSLVHRRLVPLQPRSAETAVITCCILSPSPILIRCRSVSISATSPIPLSPPIQRNGLVISVSRTHDLTDIFPTSTSHIQSFSLSLPSVSPAFYILTFHPDYSLY